MVKSMTIEADGVGGSEAEAPAGNLAEQVRWQQDAARTAAVTEYLELLRRAAKPRRGDATRCAELMRLLGRPFDAVDADRQMVLDADRHADALGKAAGLLAPSNAAYKALAQLRQRNEEEREALYAKHKIEEQEASAKANVARAASDANQRVLNETRAASLELEALVAGRDVEAQRLAARLADKAAAVPGRKPRGDVVAFALKEYLDARRRHATVPEASAAVAAHLAHAGLSPLLTAEEKARIERAVAERVAECEDLALRDEEVGRRDQG